MLPKRLRALRNAVACLLVLTPFAILQISEEPNSEKDVHDLVVHIVTDNCYCLENPVIRIDADSIGPVTKFKTPRGTNYQLMPVTGTASGPSGQIHVHGCMLHYDYVGPVLDLSWKLTLLKVEQCEWELGEFVIENYWDREGDRQVTESQNFMLLTQP